MEEEDAAAPAEPAPAPAADAETEPAPAPAPAPAPVPEPTPELDPKKLKRLKVEELRAALEALGRSTEGHKPALVERLIEARRSGPEAAEPTAAAPEPAAAAGSAPEPAPAATAAPAPAAADAETDPKKLKRWKVEDLRAALEALGRATDGTKPVLVERLVAARRAESGYETPVEEEPPVLDLPDDRNELKEMCARAGVPYSPKDALERVKNRLRKAPPSTVLHERGGGGWEMSDDDRDVSNGHGNGHERGGGGGDMDVEGSNGHGAATRTATVSTTKRRARGE